MADQPQTDDACCGERTARSGSPRECEPRALSCKLCPKSPTYWNRQGDAELRPLGQRD